MTVHVDPELTVSADADGLGHVLRNLLTNAAKYSRPGTAIRISATRGDHDDEVVVAVADEGVGIAPEMHEKVFDRFYRGADMQTGRRGTGARERRGVRVDVELMGGRVW